MQYVGLQAQISRNNRYSVLLLIAFPALLLGLFYILIFFISKEDVTEANTRFLQVLPVVLGAVGIWFLSAGPGHSAFIRMATGPKPLERKENKRVYNLVDNLCIQVGITMPAVY